MQIYDLNENGRKELEQRLRKDSEVETYGFVYEGTAIRINGEEYFTMEEVENYLLKLEVKRKIKSNKPICACGSELNVKIYKGYYDSFKYLECDNKYCNYMENTEVDSVVHGAYT